MKNSETGTEHRDAEDSEVEGRCWWIADGGGPDSWVVTGALMAHAVARSSRSNCGGPGLTDARSVDQGQLMGGLRSEAVGRMRSWPVPGLLALV
jgi:hypothetical protein